jgi:hypothetical protein
MQRFFEDYVPDGLLMPPLWRLNVKTTTRKRDGLRQVALLSSLALLAACGPQATEEPACDPDADGDGDGIGDCAEIELGTDPLLEDTDGDGMADGVEQDCVSDPLDSEEVCYSCGWAHNDPGNLESLGANPGDTIANVTLFDQCMEEVDLWDLAGEYHILFMTAAY